MNWEEKHKNLSQDIWFPVQDFNVAPPTYEAGLLTTQLWCSVLLLSEAAVEDVPSDTESVEENMDTSSK